MAAPRDIVIIGGSAAGLSAAQAIVEAAPRASVVLISAEDRLPYKRTKVSKSFAAGFEPDAFAVLEPSWYEQAGVELLLGRTVTRLDLAAHTIATDDGSTRRFDQLILATGAQPRRLPVVPQSRAAVHFAHDIAQIEALREHALGCRSVLVIGMGVLGVEVAEQLARMGKQVTLAGDGPGLLPQHLNQAAAARLARLLRDHGIALRFDAAVAEIGRQGEKLAVRFAVGHGQATFDLAVCCIGLEVRTELARSAGLAVRRGIVVDAELRTSHPDVLAAGDVAEHERHGSRLTHLWRHALQQGRIAGLNAAGGSESYELVPFRVKCTIFDRYFFALQRPDPASLDRYDIAEHRDGDRYVCGYYQDGRLTGLVMVNDGARQADYNRAVVEGWDRAAVERFFDLR